MGDGTRDLREVNERLVDRMRRSGIERHQAELLADRSISRVADRMDRGEDRRDKETRR